MISSEEKLKINKVFMLKNKHNHNDISSKEQEKLLIFNKR